MEPKPDNSPLIVIVGETGSGKTALAISLAKQFHGEVISADSRTVYKGLDIGTAKPDAGEQAGTPHHLIDIVSPNERFTVADFKLRAEKAIAGITQRGRIPFLVGGSGLYVNSVIYNFVFRGKLNLALRQELETKSVEELQGILNSSGIPLPNNPRNRVHLIRTIETNGQRPASSSLRPNTLLIGLRIDRSDLRENLCNRIERMFANGLVEEAKSLAGTYGWDVPAMRSTSYKALREYIQGTISMEEAKAQFLQNDLQLAKRQRTWFSRNKSIHWISKREEAVELVTTLLSK